MINVYNKWLRDLVAVRGYQRYKHNKIYNYEFLLDELSSTEFKTLVEMDKNRINDCNDLRLLFYKDVQWSITNRLENPVSTLEVLIRLAQRAEYISRIPMSEWFWIMLENSGLLFYHDERHPNDPFKTTEEIKRGIDILIERRYNHNGSGGGLFPLHKPCVDQTKVELWQQLNSYLIENNW